MVFSGMSGVGVSVFHFRHLCFVLVVFGGGPCTLLTIGQWTPSNCISVPICGS